MLNVEVLAVWSAFKILLIMLAISFLGLFIPAIAGIYIGISAFKNGNVIGGIAAVVIGLFCQACILYYMFNGEVTGEEDEECPYCGSGDTDGNHCYTCDDDF